MSTKKIPISAGCGQEPIEHDREKITARTIDLRPTRSCGVAPASSNVIGPGKGRMDQRLGLLFSDGSVLVLAEGADVSTAWQEAAEHDAGDSEPQTMVVLLDLEIKSRFARNENDFK